MTSRDYHTVKVRDKEYTIATEGGLTEWYFNDNLHREDGPATIYRVFGTVVKEKWFIEGKEVPFTFYSFQEYEKKIKLKAFW